MPFINICGVSGDGTTCLFACALVANESMESLKWVFDHLRACMGEPAWRQVQSVMTDGDPSFPRMLREVMPWSKHLRCIWHIVLDMDRTPIKSQLPAYVTFKTEWMKAVHAHTASESEALWCKMMDKYVPAREVSEA